MPNIQTFSGNYIAIYRKRKKTYSVLKYDTTHSKWFCHNTTTHPVTDMALNQQQIQVANVKIDIGGRRVNHTFTALFVECRASGQYIDARINNHRVHITVISKLVSSPNDFPLKTYKFEIQCAALSQLPVRTEPLWTLYAAPAVPPPPPTPPPLPIPPTVLRRRMPSQIPQRIAWIIAEDACNKGEICPITMDKITPITSAVTSCYHVFEKDALDEWFKNNASCPLCKQDAIMTVCYTPTITEATS